MIEFAINTCLEPINMDYNTAYGDRTTLVQLITLLKSKLSKLDDKITNVVIFFGPNRAGDISIL